MLARGFKKIFKSKQLPSTSDVNAGKSSAVPEPNPNPPQVAQPSPYRSETEWSSKTLNTDTTTLSGHESISQRSPSNVPKGRSKASRNASPLPKHFDLENVPQYGLGVLYEPAQQNTGPVTDQEDDAYGAPIDKRRRRAERRKAKADIVFVHGLTGSARNTWYHKESQIYWPVDLLSEHFRDVRIMSWGYDADVVKFFSPTSQNTISNHAENFLGALSRIRAEKGVGHRPIIFVAHSLGGLVVENALRISSASAEGHIRTIEECTEAILFMGTPHIGSDLGDWAKVGTNILRTVRQPNRPIIDVLRKGSEMLAEVERGFHSLRKIRTRQSQPIEIVCFYEELPLLAVGEVVPKQSAIIAGEPAYGIRANHMDMTKFNGFKDPGYISVQGEIFRLMNDIRESASEKKVLSTRDSKALQAFYKMHYNTQHERNNLRAQGTLRWFFNHEKYEEWYRNTDESTFLWVSADPGSGKSVLAASIVSELSSIRSNTIGICYFFFKDDSVLQRSATVALNCILHQLLVIDTDMLRHVQVSIELHGPSFRDNFTALWSLILSIMSEIDRNIYIVFDALDECEPASRRQLANAITQLHRPTADKRYYPLHILITSRPYQSIESAFLHLPEMRFKVENEVSSISDDIAIAVRAQTKELAARLTISPSRLQALEAALIEKSDRTFLWVSLVLKLLEDSVEGTDDEFQEVIDSIPPDLDATYTKILSGSPKPEKARKVLSIIVVASVPLTLTEVSIALALNSTSQRHSDFEGNMMSNPESGIKQLCGLFVRVIEGKVYLVHQTAREFLLGARTMDKYTTNSWKHSFSLTKSHSIMASSCIQYLTLSDIHKVYKKTEKHNFIDTLLNYAAPNWPEHFRDNPEVRKMTNVVHRAVQLCQVDSLQFKLMVSLRDDDYLASVKRQNSLIVAAYLGLSVIISILLEEHHQLNVDDQNSSGDTALQLATREGYTECVKLLLQHNADPNIPDNRGSTPLYLAVRTGNEHLVQLLLSNKSDPNISNKTSSAPLHPAARGGFTTIAKMLLDCGAFPNTQDCTLETPLHEAAQHGHYELSKLLLSHGASASLVNTFGATPLHLAASSQATSLVALFVQAGININLPDSANGSTPLHRAVSASDASMARELLRLGADPTLPNAAGQTALHLAVTSPNAELSRVLLSHKNVDTEATFRRGWTALHLAAYFGDCHAARECLEAGAKVDARTAEGDSALALAVVEGDEAMVGLLLEWGPEVTQEVVDLAEEKGWEGVWDLLVGDGACGSSGCEDVDSDGSYRV